MAAKEKHCRMSTTVDRRKPHFRLPWWDPCGNRHQHARRNVPDRAPSPYKVSVKSVQQFRRRQETDTQTGNLIFPFTTGETIVLMKLQMHSVERMYLRQRCFDG